MKYPVLTHFRGPRSHNHFVLALLAVADAAALDMALRPNHDHTEAAMVLRQASSCLVDIAYPMRRVDDTADDPQVTRTEFDDAIRYLEGVGYPITRDGHAAWAAFAAERRRYASVACQLLFWTMAPPAPWSGARHGFADLEPGRPRPVALH